MTSVLRIGCFTTRCQQSWLFWSCVRKQRSKGVLKYCALLIFWLNPYWLTRCLGREIHWYRSHLEIKPPTIVLKTVEFGVVSFFFCGVLFLCYGDRLKNWRKQWKKSSCLGYRSISWWSESVLSQIFTAYIQTSLTLLRIQNLIKWFWMKLTEISRWVAQVLMLG